MAERITANSKKPVSIKENLISHKRKTDFQSDSSTVNQILYLQRTIGNQAVQRMVRSGALQAKLRIGQPGDVYEQEADRVADAVMRMPEPGMQRQVEPEEEEEETLQSKPLANQITPLVQVQRQEELEEEEEETLQAKPLVNQITPFVQRQVEEEEEEEMLQAKATSGRISEVNSNLESHILSLKGGGQPLSENDRAFFEPRFGRDFSQVRVHTDANAAETARAVNARAFTVGQDVVFDTGQYAQGTSDGRRLMGHELMHVVQQSRSQYANQKLVRFQSQTHNKRNNLACCGQNSVVHSDLLQFKTCHVLYGWPETEYTTDLVRDRQIAINTLNGNLNSWDTWLVIKMEDAVSDLFANEREVAWWASFAMKTLADLLSLSKVLKPVSVAVKALARGGEHIANLSIEDARKRMSEDARKEVLRYKDNRREDGEKYIFDQFEELRYNLLEECGPQIDFLYNSIDFFCPKLTEVNYSELVELVKELMVLVRDKAAEERRLVEYLNCLSIELERSGGMPEEEEMMVALKFCSEKTGYPAPSIIEGEASEYIDALKERARVSGW
ncbi:MAG: protein of unknown function (DUF4157) [Candidatus Methanocomedens sp.]|nr:MAG: protein of unknown function (DUF4157) [ANME-2 cluster archaeon]